MECRKKYSPQRDDVYLVKSDVTNLQRCKDAFAYACECDVEDLGEHYVTHTLRATTATVLYNSDVPPKLIQKILGHKSLAMTMRYCHDFTDQDELRDYMQEALDRQKFVV